MGDERLFEKVIRKAKEWGNEEQIMFVVGATRGEAFLNIRKLAPSHFLLVPGVGAQGGNLEDVCKYGMNTECGLLVNSSRAILYASSGKDFVDAAISEASSIRNQMEIELRKKGGNRMTFTKIL